MKFCTQCGTQLEDFAMFCTNCGTRQPEEQAVAQPQQPAEPVPMETMTDWMSDIAPQESAPVEPSVFAEQPTVDEQPMAEEQPVFQAPPPHTPPQQPMYASYAPPPVGGFAPPPYGAPQVNHATPRSSHPVYNVLKTIGSSPLFLVAVIAFSVSLLFNFLSSITVASLGTDLVYLLEDILLELGFSRYEMYELLEAVYDITSTGSGVLILGTLIGMIPTILLCVGMWMTYASAANRQNGGMSSAGLTMIKVIQTISFVFTCIGMGLLVVVMLIAAFVGGAEEPELIAPLMLVVILFGGIAAFVITYGALILKTIGTMQNAARTGLASDKVSAFVAVMCFIGGGFTALGALFSIINFLSFLSGAASATALICFGVLIFRYRTKMREVMGIAPVAPPPVSNYYPTNTY